MELSFPFLLFPSLSFIKTAGPRKQKNWSGKAAPPVYLFSYRLDDFPFPSPFVSTVTSIVFFLSVPLFSIALVLASYVGFSVCRFGGR